MEHVDRLEFCCATNALSDTELACGTLIIDEISKQLDARLNPPDGNTPIIISRFGHPDPRRERIIKVISRLDIDESNAIAAKANGMLRGMAYEYFLDAIVKMFTNRAGAIRAPALPDWLEEALGSVDHLLRGTVTDVIAFHYLEAYEQKLIAAIVLAFWMSDLTRVYVPHAALAKAVSTQTKANDK